MLLSHLPWQQLHCKSSPDTLDHSQESPAESMQQIPQPSPHSPETGTAPVAAHTPIAESYLPDLQTPVKTFPSNVALHAVGQTGGGDAGGGDVGGGDTAGGGDVGGGDAGSGGDVGGGDAGSGGDAGGGD
eukprot:jgi/Picsp_1/454/NSC_00452-R1_---NA---